MQNINLCVRPRELLIEETESISKTLLSTGHEIDYCPKMEVK